MFCFQDLQIFISISQNWRRNGNKQSSSAPTTFYRSPSLWDPRWFSFSHCTCRSMQTNICVFWRQEEDMKRPATEKLLKCRLLVFLQEYLGWVIILHVSFPACKIIFLRGDEILWRYEIRNMLTSSFGDTCILCRFSAQCRLYVTVNFRRRVAMKLSYF